ncbi:MAG: 50S ribosomal protein L4 [Bacilli bacterium]|jgi:large subunit ribosomal protein L4|nr:50S ribosomal protein L4 [Bacilli bacterium]MCH4235819.1 50S ribosomal protein L4 [Bacilli bacterium]
MAEEKIKTISYPVVSQTGEKTTTVRLAGEVFGIEPNNQVMFDAVQTYQSNKRQATAKTKYRSEVSGGGKKPWRQKGTGRARAGSSRSTIWVGGGKVHTPDGNQNYALCQNKSAHALALRSALSLKTAAKDLIIVDSVKFEDSKTKSAVSFLKAIAAEGKILLVAENDNLALAVRNLPFVKLVDKTNVAVYDLLNADKVVFLKEELKDLEGGLK